MTLGHLQVDRNIQNRVRNKGVSATNTHKRETEQSKTKTAFDEAHGCTQISLVFLSHHRSDPFEENGSTSHSSSGSKKQWGFKEDNRCSTENS